MEPAVVAEGVTKRYGESVALDGVSLSIEPGEVFGLIGPNGAGKTTLVRALTGTLAPDAGDVRLLGVDPSGVDRDRIGVLPQAFSPPNRLTARELLTYYAGLYPAARGPETVLADVGLTDAADTWYENLSGGQRRRVCVGAALVNDPDVLVLDEPTTGIDPAGRRTVWGLVEALAESGTTVLLTTHDMAEAERLADRVGLLADGEMVATGTPEALVSEHAGESRLTVELGEPTASSAEDVGEGVDPRTIETVPYSAEARPGRLVVRDVEPRDIGAVAAALEEAGIAYTGLDWSEPGLEAVYLELAGAVEGAATTRSPEAAGDVDAVAAGGERR
ncbi:ABC transporter ATP-binding protein [Halovivax sp.]|uniref:ABC transporter ATP-binding protein n=1 Tax=Halovivax sp. TaxID=1935978 RepID=UPI0025BDDF29|nr:ABC transporter ATP-binding protein [Halovivax sp.]